jgi:sulfate transport system ATP-binding protein/putative spermidine/putrescine transport system ATP-binding protein
MSTIENLKIKKKNFQLSIQHWEILDEGIHVLMGSSGSGKSTILKAMIGIEEVVSLNWLYKGQDLAALPVEKRNLGAVFQNWDLFPHMTAYQNVKFAADVRKMNSEDFKSQWNWLSEKLKMDTFANTLADRLSGGEKQRTAFARAIVTRPRFLLLDEPFSALDADLRHESRLLLRDLVRAQKIPTLMVTHDLDEARLLADKITQIDEIVQTQR